MRRAIFGGTFDPIHMGHLVLAEQARQFLRLDEIQFLPSCIPPLKGKPTASAEQRLAMIRLAILGNPFFRLNEWEIRQNRVVYSTETIQYFKQEWPKDSLFFIVGSDSLATIDRWKDGRKLLKECSFVAMERPGALWKDLPLPIRKHVKRVPFEALPYSSSSIRQLLRRGRSVRYQIPERVESYIFENQLYGMRTA